MTDWLSQQQPTPILLAQARPAPAITHTSTAVPAPAPTSADNAGETSPRTFFQLSLLAFLIIVVGVVLGTRRLKIVPHGLQNVLEMLIEILYSLPEMVMGPRGRQYAPFVSTFAIYIVVMNALGLIPFLKSPTASLSVTLGMAIVAFVGVQYFGFKAQGVKYLAHFVGPVPWLVLLFLPLEIVAELVRPVSLSMRLYGNIFGEEQVISAFAHNLSPIAAVIILPLQVITVPFAIVRLHVARHRLYRPGNGTCFRARRGGEGLLACLASSRRRGAPAGV